MWSAITILTLLAAGETALPPDVSATAAAIDRELESRFAAESIVPAPRAGDAEFLRRVSLDLVGRIPRIEELNAFLADDSPDKRAALISACLDDSQHADHFARVWRGLLLPEAATDRQLRYFQPGLEAWLRDYRRRDVGLNVLVRDLLAMPLVPAGQPPQMVLTDMRAPNPLAYIASKEADPAKLAANTARLFLGVRLECAQCHDHPFDHWTHHDFWSQAAFFAGIQRKGTGPFAPLSEAADKRTITTMDSEETVAPAFLTGARAVSDSALPRIQFADWIVSSENPQFALAMVNRAWGQLMGIGLVEPVDDFGDLNPPSHPEILDLLADAFIASSFDLDLLYESICRSEAYQRTSRQTDDSQTERTFARMSIKTQSGDQLFDSLALAVAFAPASANDLNRDEDPVRRKFLDLFTDQNLFGEPETSVATALTLINGRLTADASNADSSPRLKQLLGDPTLNTPERIDALFRATLSRPADPAELAPLIDYVDATTSADSGHRLGDVFWMLLNSAEFRWNH